MRRISDTTAKCCYHLYGAAVQFDIEPSVFRVTESYVQTRGAHNAALRRARVSSKNPHGGSLRVHDRERRIKGFCNERDLRLVESNPL